MRAQQPEVRGTRAAVEEGCALPTGEGRWPRIYARSGAETALQGRQSFLRQAEERAPQGCMAGGAHVF